MQGQSWVIFPPLGGSPTQDQAQGRGCAGGSRGDQHTGGRWDLGANLSPSAPRYQQDRGTLSGHFGFALPIPPGPGHDRAGLPWPMTPYEAESLWPPFAHGAEQCMEPPMSSDSVPSPRCRRPQRRNTLHHDPPSPILSSPPGISAPAPPPFRSHTAARGRAPRRVPRAEVPKPRVWSPHGEGGMLVSLLLPEAAAGGWRSGIPAGMWAGGGAARGLEGAVPTRNRPSSPGNVLMGSASRAELTLGTPAPGRTGPC